jgi:hypothetical protein
MPNVANPSVAIAAIAVAVRVRDLRDEDPLNAIVSPLRSGQQVGAPVAASNRRPRWRDHMPAGRGSQEECQGSAGAGEGIGF